MTRDDVGAIVRELVKGFSMHPWDINNGECEEFANKLEEALRERGVETESLGVPIEELPGHVWVYVPGLRMHFDAETPYGEDCFLKLAVFMRYMAGNDKHPGPWTEGQLETLGETKGAANLLRGRARTWVEEIQRLAGKRVKVVNAMNAVDVDGGQIELRPGSYHVEPAGSGRMLLRGRSATDVNFVAAHTLAWAWAIEDVKAAP